MSKRILIIGSDVVGLVTACFLHNIEHASVSLIGKPLEQYVDSRINLTPRSLELLSLLGIGEQIITSSTLVNKVSVSTLDSEIVMTDLGRLLSKKTKHTFLYIVSSRFLIDLLMKFLHAKAKNLQIIHLSSYQIRQSEKGSFYIDHPDMQGPNIYDNLIVSQQRQQLMKISSAQIIKAQQTVLKGYQCIAQDESKQTQSTLQVIIDTTNFVVIIPLCDNKVKIWTNSPDYRTLIRSQIKVISQEKIDVYNQVISKQKRKNQIVFIGSGAHKQPSICDGDVNLGIQEALVLSSMLKTKTEKHFQKYFSHSIRPRVERMKELTKKAFSLDITWTSKMLPVLKPIIKRKINSEIIPFFTGLSQQLPTPTPNL